MSKLILEEFLKEPNIKKGTLKASQRALLRATRRASNKNLRQLKVLTNLTEEEVQTKAKTARMAFKEVLSVLK